MCGIVAVRMLAGARSASDLVTPMVGTLAHRGPDDAGVFVEGQIGLGFKRLAILDLSPTGHQPMRSADDTAVLVFNGEIFNYVELREELRTLGHTFRSTGDAEVLLQAYLQWGEDCLRRFNAEERPGAPVVNHECPFAIEAPQAVLAPLEVGLQQDFSVAGGTKGMPQGAELFPKLDVVENLAVEHQHGGIVSAPHRLVAGGAEIEDRQALEAKADLAFDEHTGVIGTTVRQRADHRGHQIRRAPCAGEHANSHDAAHGYRIASISIAEPSHHN